MPQSFASLHHHLVFSTKDRNAWLDEALRSRLFEYVGGVLSAERCQLVASGGMPDHVHLLVSLHPSVTVSDAMRTIKSCSSKWVHKTFPDRRSFAWQNGYGAFAVSHSHVDKVRRYIANQAEHHRVMLFQEEYIAFLKKHGIGFDERYLWE